jgi:hypothetical protein
MVAATLAALEPLRAAHLPLVLVHGDLGHPNLVLTRQGRLGAMDWERAQLAGLPLTDACFFLQYVSESRRGVFERVAQLRCFDEAFADRHAWAGPLLRREARRLGVDLALVPPLVLATWAVSAAGLLRRAQPQQDHADGRHSDGPSPDLLEIVGQDRDLALWRHALHRFPSILGD